MTDKQIIIDGVDVSGCENYEENPKYRMFGTCDCMRTMVDQSGYDELAGAECKGYNCYYKQLKRKEQECEELKKIINEAKNSKLDLKSFLVGEAVQNEYEQQLNQLKAENDKLKNCLTEIKEIVTLDKTSFKYAGSTISICDDILIKINECEGNND